MTDTASIKQKLKEEYPYRVELHAHTSPVSPCSRVKPQELVQIFYESGYSGIAITNHFFPGLLGIEDAGEYAEAFKKDLYIAEETGAKLGIKIYRGAELRFPNESDNDYLIYGWTFDELPEIHEYLKGDFATFAREYKKDTMFITQAHPFRDNMTRADTSLLDAVEAFNMHPHHNSRIALAVKHADENNKIMTVGTDYHHKGHHNLSATRFRKLPEDTAELVSLLKSNDFIIETGSKIII